MEEGFLVRSETNRQIFLSTLPGRLNRRNISPSARFFIHDKGARNRNRFREAVVGLVFGLGIMVARIEFQREAGKGILMD